MKTDRRRILNLIEKVIAKRERRGECKAHLPLTTERFESFLLLKDINTSLKVNMVDIHNNDLYEIYTCNAEPIDNPDRPYHGCPAGSVSGWDIKWILAPNREAIKRYPFFDCIISKNDNSTGQALDAELFLN